MKKIIKTIIFISVVFTVFFSNTAFAAVLNGDPLDYDTLQVTNYTNNPNCNSCWSSSANADAGDTVSFVIYYHNSSAEIAKNVRVRLLPQNTNNAASHSFSAYVWADNAPQVSGVATVYLSSAQSLSYIPSATFWYPNQTQSSQIPPFGQNGDELFSSNGLLIGDIEPGWSTQGSVVARFVVSDNQQQGQAPSVTTNSATNISQSQATLRGYVDPKQTTDTVRWFEWGTSSTNLSFETSHISQGAGASDFSDVISGLSPNTRYYFRALAQNEYGLVRGSILSFRTDDIAQGQAPSATTNSATNISQNSISLNCYVNPNGVSTSRWFEWGDAYLSLQNSTNHISQNSTGSFSEYIDGLSADTTYYFRCVAQNDYGIRYGNTLSFTTSSTGGGEQKNLPSVTTYSADGVGKNFAVLRGYVDPKQTTDTVRWFEWGTDSWNLQNSTTKIAQGNFASSFSDTISGLSANTVYYFRAVARNQHGTVYGTIQSFGTSASEQQRPFVATYSATDITSDGAMLNGYVNPYNEVNTSRWFEYGPTQSLGYSTNKINHGSTASNFSDYVDGLLKNRVYYFRAVAQNPYGTSYGNILSFSTGLEVPRIDTAPEAITNLATNIGQRSARLNGLAIVSGDKFTLGWFEYGTTRSLGSKTASEALGSAPSMSFKYSLFGLSPNTTYYYRAVVKNDNGVDYGDIFSFRTNSLVIKPTPSVEPVKTRSLSIRKELRNLVNENGNTTRVEALRGDKIRFSIIVENTGDYILENVEIKDRVPHYLEFANAEDENINDPQREVVWFVGDMRPGEREEVILDMIVTAEARIGGVIENVAQAQTKKMTKTSNSVEILPVNKLSSMSASVLLGSDNFLPDTLIEWLLLIVLIFIIVVLSRKTYGYYKDKKENKNGNSK